VFNSRTSAAARRGLVASCIAITCVSVASECGPAATAESGVYGDPAAAAKYWQEQSLEDNCGLMAVADVVGEITGNSPTERQMIKLAQHTPSGTSTPATSAPTPITSWSSPESTPTRRSFTSTTPASSTPTSRFPSPPSRTPGKPARTRSSSRRQPAEPRAAASSQVSLFLIFPLSAHSYTDGTLDADNKRRA
jgi:hypothetical protein